MFSFLSFPLRLAPPAAVRCTQPKRAHKHTHTREYERANACIHACACTSERKRERESHATRTFVVRGPTGNRKKRRGRKPTKKAEIRVVLVVVFFTRRFSFLAFFSIFNFFKWISFSSLTLTLTYTYGRMMSGFAAHTIRQCKCASEQKGNQSFTLICSCRSGTARSSLTNWCVHIHYSSLHGRRPSSLSSSIACVRV